MRILSVIPLLVAFAASAPAVDFDTDIAPIFKAKCHQCHGEEQQLGQLRLDARSVAMATGPSGPRIVARSPEASTLYQRVAGLGEGVRMPMGGQLAEDEIEAIRAWIEQGAHWPEGAGTDEGLNQHWSFLPPVRPQPPESPVAWGKNAIDRFVLAKLQAEGLTPSPRASKEALVRRLSLDITGLPPTVADTDRFVGDTEPGAYERLVERMLASPHYGERWGRVWLDAARYADSDGFEKDKPRQVWFLSLIHI